MCFFSSYYAAALNGKFIEAKNDRFEVDLSEEHLHAFADWIYTGSFNMEFLSETEECLYVNLYLFADQMDIIALRRSALSNLADRGRTGRFATRTAASGNGLIFHIYPTGTFAGLELNWRDGPAPRTRSSFSLSPQKLIP